MFIQYTTIDIYQDRLHYTNLLDESKQYTYNILSPHYIHTITVVCSEPVKQTLYLEHYKDFKKLFHHNEFTENLYT